MTDKLMKCPACSGRGYNRCECWPGDCICGYGDETCDECAGDGWIDQSYDDFFPDIATPETLPPVPNVRATDTISRRDLLQRMSFALDDLSPDETIGYSNGVGWIEVATVEEIRRAARTAHDAVAAQFLATEDGEFNGNDQPEPSPLAQEKQPDYRHNFVPNKKYPWFCAQCGYPPHEPLKHVQPPAASEGSTDGH